MDTAYEQLANRLKRVHRHLRKWARRTGVTCYRLYEKRRNQAVDQADISELLKADAQPLALTRY